MKHDPMCWQLALGLDADGNRLADTARNRNKRLTGMPEMRTIRWKSNGSGVVHTDYRGPSRRKVERLRLVELHSRTVLTAAQSGSRLIPQRRVPAPTV